MPVNTPDLSPLGGGNDGLTTEAHITSVGRLSVQTIGTAISPAMAFESERSLGWYRSAASTVALSYGTVVLQGGASLGPNSGGGLSLGTYSFSITTAAAATSIPDAHLGLVFRASGISLVYVSGGTVYSFGSSGVGASFASGTA